MSNPIYYLTGMGGALHTGLGQAILQRGFNVTGRQLSGEFRNISFQNQIDAVCNDLKEHFWHEDAIVVANSFGAYIFLHAQTQLAGPYVGKTLLLSPIVGEFANNDNVRPMNFIPPRSTRLMELAESGLYPAPRHCEMYVGSEDWQANPDNVSRFGSLVGLDVHVVPKAGHMLPKEYVSDLLDEWLT
jgi:predicted alpha/beta hydrolase family esterase